MSKNIFGRFRSAMSRTVVMARKNRARAAPTPSDGDSVPLVTVALDGAFAAWPRRQRVPGLAPIEIVFGETLSADEVATLSEASFVETKKKSLEIFQREVRR